MPIDYVEISLYSLLVAAICLLFIGFVVVLSRDSRWFRVGWSSVIGILSLFALCISGSFVARSYLVVAMVELWAIRLGLFRYLYKNMTTKATAGLDIAFTERISRVTGIDRVVLGGLLSLGLSLPFVYVHYSAFGSELTAIDIGGTLIWFVGFMLETVSEVQLVMCSIYRQKISQFKRCGLWKLSRHPNWFGFVLQWWGISLLVISIPGLGWTSVSALLLSFVASWLSSSDTSADFSMSDEEFESYRMTTNSFIPWFQRKSMVDRIKV